MRLSKRLITGSRRNLYSRRLKGWAFSLHVNVVGSIRADFAAELFAFEVNGHVAPLMAGALHSPVGPSRLPADRS